MDLSGLGAILQDWLDYFLKLPAKDQLALVWQALGISLVSVLGNVIGGIWALLRGRSHARKLADQRRINDDLARENKDLADKLTTADQARRAFDPGEWLAKADALERTNRRDDAAEALRIGFENLRADLASVMRRLADHQADRAMLRPQEIGEAEALARIAALLAPEDKDAAGLALELAEVKAAADFETGCYDPTAPEWAEPIFELHGDKASAEVAALCARADALIKVGEYFVALRVATFAARLAEGANLSARHTCRAKYYVAAALRFAGRYAEALAAIEAYAPIMQSKFGPKHPNVLATETLRAAILRHLHGKEDGGGAPPLQRVSANMERRRPAAAIVKRDVRVERALRFALSREDGGEAPPLQG